MTKYTIGKKGDYKTFDEVFDDLKSGDVVLFLSGSHVLRDSYDIERLTIQGDDASSTRLFFDQSFEGDSENKKTRKLIKSQPKFNVLEDSGLIIENITLVVPPLVDLIRLNEKSDLLVIDSVIIWNSYNLKQISDNLSVIRQTKGSVSKTFTIKGSILSTINVVASDVRVENTLIGSMYGEAGYLSGFSRNSDHVMTHNMTLGLSGELSLLHSFGNTVISDIDPLLINRYPRLKHWGFNISALMGMEKHDKSFKVSGTQDKRAEYFLKKTYQTLKKEYKRKKEKLPIEYLITNTRVLSPTYATIKTYAIPHTIGILENKGILVLTGQNKSKSTFSNAQTDGVLVLNNFETGLTYTYSGGDVFIHNSQVGFNKKIPQLAETKTWTELDQKKIPITYNNDEFDSELALQTAEEITAELANQNPISDVMNENTPLLIKLFNRPEDRKMILIESNQPSDAIKEQLIPIAESLHHAKLINGRNVQRISENTLMTKDPTTIQKDLIARLGNVIMTGPIRLVEKNVDANLKWLKLLKLITTFNKNDINSIVILFDTKENLNYMVETYPLIFENTLRLDGSLPNILE